MKRVSWRVCLFAVLAWVASGATIRAAEPVDPLVGDWLYHKNHPVKFNVDGTADWQGSFHGTWEYLHNPEVQRHYRIVWDHGKSVDTLILAEDGQHGHVNNQTGHHNQYDVRRAIPDKPAAAPPARALAASVPASPVPAVPGAAAATPSVSVMVEATDPVLGDWLWFKGRPVTFKPDGTVDSPKNPQGVWEYLHNPGTEREYRVTWANGKTIDSLIYASGAQKGRVQNTRGKHSEYDVRRVAAGEHANYFGVPGQ